METPIGHHAIVGSTPTRASPAGARRRRSPPGAARTGATTARPRDRQAHRARPTCSRRIARPRPGGHRGRPRPDGQGREGPPVREGRDRHRLPRRWPARRRASRSRRCWAGGTATASRSRTRSGSWSRALLRRGRAGRRGGRLTIKCKTGLDPERDVELVRRLRATLGDDVKIRVDGNEGYRTVTEAVEVTRRQEEYASLLCEQPVAGHRRRSRAWRERIESPVMADESAWTVHDILELYDLDAAACFSCYVTKPGGLHRARQQAELAAALGIYCDIGGSIETRDRQRREPPSRRGAAERDAASASVPSRSRPAAAGPEVAGIYYLDDVVTEPFRFARRKVMVPGRAGARHRGRRREARALRGLRQRDRGAVLGAGGGRSRRRRRAHARRPRRALVEPHGRDPRAVPRGGRRAATKGVLGAGFARPATIATDLGGRARRCRRGDGLPSVARPRAPSPMRSPTPPSRAPSCSTPATRAARCTSPRSSGRAGCGAAARGAVDADVRRAQACTATRCESPGGRARAGGVPARRRGRARRSRARALSRRRRRARTCSRPASPTSTSSCTRRGRSSRRPGSRRPAATSASTSTR